MSRIRRHSGRAVSVAFLLVLAGCLDTHRWTAREQPWDQGTVAETDRVRLQRSDGTRITLDKPRIDRDEQGTFLAGRDVHPPGAEVRINLESIRSLEVREVDTGKTLAAIAAGILVVGAIVLYLTNPFLPSG